MGDMCNLHVSGLPAQTTEESFKQMFEGYGNITSCKYMADKRYGFVRYASSLEAEAVIGAVNGFVLNGSQLNVCLSHSDTSKGKGKGKDWGKDAWADSGGWGDASGGWGAGYAAPAAASTEAVPGDNLYVTGLPPNMSEQAINEIFGAYGSVKSSRILNPQGKGRDGAACSIALIRMGGVDQATWMVVNVNNNIPQGLTTPVQIRYADPPGSRKGKGKDGKDEGKGPGLGGDPMGGKGGGYGPSWDAGGKGKDRYDPYGGGGGGGKGGKGPGGPCPPPSLADHAYNGRPPIYTDGDEGSNLYVRGLPQDADDLWLYKAFGPFGGIVSVRAMTEEGWCIGYGFVKFALTTEASKAINAMNNFQLQNGGYLQVSVKSSTKGKGKGSKSDGVWDPSQPDWSALTQQSWDTSSAGAGGMPAELLSAAAALANAAAMNGSSLPAVPSLGDLVPAAPPAAFAGAAPEAFAGAAPEGSWPAA